MAKGSETGGCLNCYAARAALRRPAAGLAVMRPSGPRWIGNVQLVEKRLTIPLHWREPRRIFVNSMSDLFHEALPDEAIDRVFAVMALCPQHTFQVLTKRPERMLAWASREFLGGDIRIQINEMEDRREHYPGFCELGRRRIEEFWPLPNIWLGASVENRATADARIPLLLRTPAAKRFVSYEPALGPVTFRPEWLRGRPLSDGARLDQIIVGGESGPSARPLNLRWVRFVIRQCRDAGVACFVKQLGARPGTPSCDDFACTHPDCGTQWLKLKDLKGGNPDEWPEDLRVREFPQ